MRRPHSAVRDDMSFSNGVLVWWNLCAPMYRIKFRRWPGYVGLRRLPAFGHTLPALDLKPVEDAGRTTQLRLFVGKTILFYYQRQERRGPFPTILGLTE